VPDWSPRRNASNFSWLSLTPNLSSRKKTHSRLAGEGEFGTENAYPDAHHLISRSVAANSEVWTCNFSPPKKESGSCGSGGTFESRGEEMTEMDGLEPGDTRRPGGFLRTQTSSSDRVRPCEG